MWNVLSQNKTIAVTGANGFLGRNCLSKAMKMGFRVRGVVRRPETAKIVKELGAESIIVKNFDEDTLMNAFQGCDGVIHLIGIVNEKYGTFEETNVRGTRIVLKCTNKSQVPRFVTPSGLGVDQYSRKPWATNGYFASKMEIERMCQSSSVPYVIFRPTYILGPGDELLPSLVDAIHSGKAFTVNGGKTPMQPLFVGDATEVFLRAAIGWGKVNSIYDLVGPEVVSLLELIHRVAGIMQQEGFDVPHYKIVDLLPEEAMRVMDLSKEEVDVMMCDVLGNPEQFTRDFNIKSTSLDEAIRVAVRAERDEESK
ncbi:MAG: Epimerase protein [Thermoproteota archaeon]|nr:Epimerase protein [Thermoproteota archaeon]